MNIDRSGKFAEEEPGSKVGYAAIILAGMVCLVVFYLVSRSNYPLFHSFADMATVFVSASVFVVVWNGRRQLDNHYFLYVSIAFLFFAFLDFMHLLGNKNMGVFPQYGNLGPTLYIASRYVLSISLVLAPLFIKRKLNTTFVFAVYSLVTTLIMLSIFYWKIFPVTYIEGVGLTSFKVISDYIICLILLAAIGLLVMARRAFDARVLRFIIYSLVLSIATGLAFTTYTDPFGITNAIGHFFQIASFSLVYLAFVNTVLTKPQDILYRSLKHSEDALQKANENLEELVRVRTTKLAAEVTQRKLAEERTRRLNSVLGTLRSVNQLIVHEKDRQRLIQKSCDLLVETPCYRLAWILLVDEAKSFASVAFAGPGKNVISDLVEQLKRGEYLQCAREVLSRESSFVACDDVEKQHKGCPLTSYHAGGAAFTALLEYGGRIHGTISVDVPRDAIMDSEERGLFRELTGDISFALASIEGEEKRKKAEENERATVERYHKTLDVMKEGGQIIGFDWRYLYVNDAAAKHGRRIREELTGRTMMEMYPGIETTDMFAALRPCMESRTPQQMESQFTYPDGSNGWFELSIEPVPDGIFILSLDITERKKAEGKIERAAEEWRTTFDSITDLVSIHDKDFKLVRVNKAFANALKMQPQELIGKTCYQVVHGTTEPVPECPHIKTLATRKSAKGEFFDPRLGIHLEVITSPIFDNKGEVVASVHIARDITERKKMEEQLMVSDRMASIGQLASGIAHELNNPLTAVIGFSELLLEKDLSPNIKEDVMIINKQAKRTANVVKGLLTFARKQKTEKELVDISGVIQGILQLRSYEQRVSNIEVRLRFTDDLSKVMGNAGQLQQVFINIIVNAEQAMLEAHGRGTLTITTEQVGDIVRASVADDGPRISPENLRKVFTPFFTTKEVGKGTGLGLSICHGIVTEHGGQIYARSEPGEGATFVVDLPVTKQQ